MQPVIAGLERDPACGVVIMCVVFVTVSGDPLLWGGPMHAAGEHCTDVGRGVPWFMNRRVR